MEPEIYLRLKEPERRALREHQTRIRSRDKNKRRRAMNEYRQFCDYLVRVGRLTKEQGVKLWAYRMDERHVG